MQKCTKNSKGPKLPPVGTILVVNSIASTNPSGSIAKVGFLCRVTEATKVAKHEGLKPFFINLDFNFKENEFITSTGIWDWYCHELEEITLIQEDI